MAGRHNFAGNIERKRTEAKARQEASDKLSLEQKITRSKPGSKEHSKYNYRLANSKK